MDWGKLIGRMAEFNTQVASKPKAFAMTFVVMLLILGGATETFSQQAGIIRKLTLAQVSEFVSNQGWPVAKGDDTSILTKIEGSTARIALGKTGERVMLLGFKQFDAKAMSSERINEFNELAFGRASTFKFKESLVFISNVEIEGGVTRDRVISFLNSARSAFVLWDEFF